MVFPQTFDLLTCFCLQVPDNYDDFFFHVACQRVSVLNVKFALFLRVRSIKNDNLRQSVHFVVNISYNYVKNISCLHKY